MNSSSRRNLENNRAKPTCFGKSRKYVLHSLVLSVSTLVFIISMTLTVYGTQKSSKDNVIVILIVTACVLYLSSFISNLYHILYSKPNHDIVRNTENSYASDQATRSFAQSSLTSGRLPGYVNFSRANQLLRTTPPPPYEIQMTEMSRMLFPDTSEIANMSPRDSEIMKEARKLVSRLYEEIQKNDQQVVQSPRMGRSIQHVVHKPEAPARQQEKIIPKVSHPNLTINLQETGVKSAYDGRFTLADIFPNRSTKKKGTAKLITTQPISQRLVIGGESPPQPSSNRQDSLQVARKRKLYTRSKEIQTKSTKEHSAQVVIGKNDTQDHIYEPVEGASSTESAYDLVKYNRVYSKQSSPVCSAASEPPTADRRRNFQNPVEGASSTESAYDLVKYNRVYFSKQSSPVCSAASEPPTADRRRNFQKPTAKVRRTLSAPTSRKFHQLGQSPDSVLDAIATSLELTPDEWMVAWKLGNKGVSPINRAKILGVDLHEDSSNDSN